MPKVAFITLGCKVNQYETNAMSQEFIENSNCLWMLCASCQRRSCQNRRY